MIKVSTAEFQENIGKYQGLALKEPVAVIRDGREETVLLSADEYRHLRGTYRRVIGPGDLSDEELEEILKAEIPPEAAVFNHELED